MTQLRTYHVTLESYETEGKFAFVDVDECMDTGECIDHLRREFPNYDVISIEDTTNDTK